MTEVISTVQVVMQAANYRTREVSGSKIATVGFEDEATMGFVSVFDAPRQMILGWRELEATMLARYATHFRAAGDKAWNVYSVFITEASASEEERREVRWIEEDLERTRKITRTGVVTRDDVVKALLPLLPIVAKPLLEPEDSKQRLLRRIEVIAPRVRDVVLDDAVSPKEVAALLRSVK
jgi:hypothetical protein